MIAQNRDWCQRLEEAVAEGRFAEDPAFWQEHVDGCKSCQKIVAGYFTLRDLINRAEMEAPETPPLEPERVIQLAMARYRAHCRAKTRWTGLGLAALALSLTAAIILFTRPEPEAPTDPIAYARALHDAVFPTGQPPRTDLLRLDEARRLEYVKALDHPVSLIRRTALNALALSGVDMDAGRLEMILARSHEDLETPLEVASLASDARTLVGALESRRIATLRSVLTAAGINASRGAPPVKSSLLTPHLASLDVETRKATLFALTADKAFMPTQDVDRLLKSDPDLDVRVAAAGVFLARLGDKAAAEIIAHLRIERGDPLEERLLPRLQRSSEVLALSRQRVADPVTPVRLALLHAGVLARVDRAAVPRPLVERALADPGTDVHRLLGEVAAEADWSQYRAALQQRWRSATGEARQDLGLTLAAWDDRTGEDPRLLLALEIAETDRGRQRALVERLARSASPAVAQRARDVLKTWPVK